MEDEGLPTKGGQHFQIVAVWLRARKTEFCYILFCLVIVLDPKEIKRIIFKVHFQYIKDIFSAAKI